MRLLSSMLPIRTKTSSADDHVGHILGPCGPGKRPNPPLALPSEADTMLLHSRYRGVLRMVWNSLGQTQRTSLLRDRAVDLDFTMIVAIA